MSASSTIPLRPPLPGTPPPPKRRLSLLPPDPEPVGYHALPLLKAPVWTWEVPLYFWLGGVGGMAAVIALASLGGSGSLGVARAALYLATFSALVSPVLLVLDLGRPARFLNMLRVIKPGSAMSVGVWTLVIFGVTSTLALFSFESFALLHHELEIPKEVLSTLTTLAMVGAGLSGAVLATYTGVLLGVTAIPVWASHAKLLPFHFGTAALGSAASALVLLDHATPAISLIALATVIVETVLLVVFETVRRGVLDRVLRIGSIGRRLRLAMVAMGPVSLLAWMVELPALAALVFLTGSLTSRFAWVAAGRASAADTEAAFVPQR